MANTVVQPPVADVASITDPIYAYKSDNGFFSAEFAQTIGTADAVKFTANGYSFAWKPENVIYVDDAGNMDVVFGVNGASTAQVYKSRVSYVGTSQITTDIFDCENNQLKHTIQMVAPPRLPAGYIGTPAQMASGGVITYDPSLKVFADGQVQTTDFMVIGDIGFKDASGALIYKLPMITVEDANGQTTQGTYKVTFNADGSISFYGMVPWAWLQTAAYPVIIDPTVIVSSAYDTSLNNGRKQVRLSNNWIVNKAYSSSATTDYFFVSKDNGQTWAQLCYCSTVTATGSSIASSGTVVYWAGNCGGAAKSVAFDATTVANGDIKTSLVGILISGISSLTSQFTIGVDNVGSVWVSFAVATLTYANSKNIVWFKSTNGGTSWSAIAYITTDNTSGINHTAPCLVFTSNGYPTLVWQYVNGSTANSIYASTWTGSAFGAIKTVYAGGSLQQVNPCSVTDGNDVFCVVWSGLDATFPNAKNIKFSKSSDGVNWSAMVNLTNLNTGGYDQSLPSITTDPQNNLYVFIQGIDSAVSTTYANIRKVVNTAGTWGAVTTITSNTTNHAQNPQTLWSKFNMNSADAIRYMWEDNQVASVKYDSIINNTPPNAPTLTAHGNFDATTAQTLAWLFSDPDSGNTQSAYQLQLYDTTNLTTPVIDTGKIGSTVSSYSLAANALANGKNYQWRVQTWDQSGAQGPYSGYSTFSTSAAPSVTITSPANGGTVNLTSVTTQWTYSDPAGNIQQSYHVQLLDSNDSVVLEDTGIVVNATANSRTMQTALANNTYYHLKAWVTNNKGITSAVSDIYFQTSFTQPATPTVATSNNATNSSVTVTFTNPTPSGGQPTVSSNNVYRRPNGTTIWKLISQGVTSPFVDYTCPLGSYDYAVTGVSASGVESGYGTSTAQSSFTGEQVIDESNPANNVTFLYNQRESDATVNQSYTPVQTFAKYPRIRKGQARYRTGNLTALKLDKDGDVNTQVNAIDNMCNSDGTYLLKSVNGRIYRVSLSQFKYTGKYGKSQADVSVVWTEVGEV